MTLSIPHADVSHRYGDVDRLVVHHQMLTARSRRRPPPFSYWAPNFDLNSVKDRVRADGWNDSPLTTGVPVLSVDDAFTLSFAERLSPDQASALPACLDTGH